MTSRLKASMLKAVKEIVKSIPIIGPTSRSIMILLWTALFHGSERYWESRYASGETSGVGSYEKFAEFKAEVVDSFVRDYNVRSVIEFGCGDGNQLSLATYPAYIGLDVSKTALRLCKERFRHDETKTFFLYDSDNFVNIHSKFRAEPALSLDVIFHLVEDTIFELHMKHLFSAADKFVIIYSSDTDVNHPHQAPHIKHRHFSQWIETNLPEWKLLRRLPNRYPFEGDDQTGSFCDFVIYEKT